MISKCHPHRFVAQPAIHWWKESVQSITLVCKAAPGSGVDQLQDLGVCASLKLSSGSFTKYSVRSSTLTVPFADDSRSTYVRCTNAMNVIWNQAATAGNSTLLTQNMPQLLPLQWLGLPCLELLELDGSHPRSFLGRDWGPGIHFYPPLVMTSAMVCLLVMVSILSVSLSVSLLISMLKTDWLNEGGGKLNNDLTVRSGKASRIGVHRHTSTLISASTDIRNKTRPAKGDIVDASETSETWYLMTSDCTCSARFPPAP